MITPVRSVHPLESRETSQPATRKPEPPVEASRSGRLSHDQVTLRSAGEVDHDREE